VVSLFWASSPSTEYVKHALPHILAAVLLGVIAGAAGLMVVTITYARHCNALLPLFRQLLPA
jgi:hypothetical protein